MWCRHIAMCSPPKIDYELLARRSYCYAIAAGVHSNEISRLLFKGNYSPCGTPYATNNRPNVW